MTMMLSLLLLLLLMIMMMLPLLLMLMLSRLSMTYVFPLFFFGTHCSPPRSTSAGPDSYVTSSPPSPPLPLPVARRPPRGSTTTSASTGASSGRRTSKVLSPHLCLLHSKHNIGWAVFSFPWQRCAWLATWSIPPAGGGWRSGQRSRGCSFTRVRCGMGKKETLLLWQGNVVQTSTLRHTKIAEFCRNEKKKDSLWYIEGFE